MKEPQTIPTGDFFFSPVPSSLNRATALLLSRDLEERSTCDPNSDLNHFAFRSRRVTERPRSPAAGRWRAPWLCKARDGARPSGATRCSTAALARMRLLFDCSEYLFVNCETLKWGFLRIQTIDESETIAQYRIFPFHCIHCSVSS
jgi:hypothetical protein